MYKELIVNDIEELVSIIMSDTENIDIAYRIIAKYEEASAILKELLQYEETSVYYLEIWSEDCDGYDKEFLITIDSTLAILCEPLYQDGTYLFYDSDKVFVMDGCSQKSVADCKEDIVTIVMYSDSIDERDCDCKECVCKDISKPSTMGNYFINGNPVDKEVFDEYNKTFKARVKEFEDEMDAWRRMLFNL